jgi:GDPmannose 4,6-dehydratase
MKRTALVTGIAGQDGSYLAELLLEKGYEVIGLIPRRSTPETQTLRIDHIRGDLKLEYGDVLDIASIYRVMHLVRPSEVYHLAAQSHVQISFTEPLHTTSVISLGTLHMLEATHERAPEARFYNAASSEIFGNTPDYPITETSRMIPASPYAAAKLGAFHLTRIYRATKGLYAVNGILFNHESPRRGLNFVTAKVVKGALDIRHGRADKLELGNLDARRDWGHARDYVRGMWLMLQQDEPDDYILATGQELSVRELCRRVFDKLGLGDYQRHVVTAERFIRPLELDKLRGDASKARRVLGWEPRIGFDEMIDEMIEELERRFYGTSPPPASPALDRGPPPS